LKVVGSDPSGAMDFSIEILPAPVCPNTGFFSVIPFYLQSVKVHSGKSWQVYALVGVEVIRLLKMLNMTSLHLETKSDVALLVSECYQYGRRNCSNCRHDENWAGRNQVSIAKYIVLSCIISIGKLLCN
jgi:hypothetical protein